MKNTKKILLITIVLLVVLTSCTKTKDTLIMLPQGDLKVGTIELRDQVFDDLRFPVEVLKITGVSDAPTYEPFLNSTYALGFEPNKQNNVYISAQLPHSRRANTTLVPHFHWASITNSTGSVVEWCMQYTCANIGDIFPPTQVKCVTDEGSDAYRHMMTNNAALLINNTLGSSAMCSFHLYRNGVGGIDNYTDDAYLLEFDIHYEVYRFGEP